MGRAPRKKAAAGPSSSPGINRGDLVRLKPDVIERFPFFAGRVGIAAVATGSVIAIHWPGFEPVTNFKTGDVEAAR
jgi:hypothetical protein